MTYSQLENNLTKFEVQTLIFVNSFVNWYYTNLNGGSHNEPLYDTLDRFGDSMLMDTFTLADMCLDLAIVSRVIKKNATAEDLTTWYSSTHIDLLNATNFKNWLIQKRGVVQLEILDKNMKPTGEIIRGVDFGFSDIDQDIYQETKNIRNSTKIKIDII